MSKQAKRASPDIDAKNVGAKPIERKFTFEADAPGAHFGKDGPSALGAKDAPLALGVNQKWESAIRFAAERAHADPATVAALLNAEAGRDKHGAWDPDAKNPKSSATGLAQFMPRTWREMAERPDTYLHEIAAANGWLDKHGKFLPKHEAELQALRKDGQISIVTAAEYSAPGVKALQRQGLIPTDVTPTQQARYFYLVHHEGAAGAARLITGELNRETARKSMADNFVGTYAKLLRSEVSGPAVAWEEAYPVELKKFIEHKIEPNKWRAPIAAEIGARPAPDSPVAIAPRLSQPDPLSL